MPTQVKVCRWGNSLGVRLTKSFVAQKSITEGTLIDLDSLVVVTPPRRRSRYKLAQLLQGYKRPPKALDLGGPVGKEII